MKKWYVYVSEYGTRVYADIYEANSKDEVKKLLLQDTKDWLNEVKLRRGKNGLNQYITSIHEISGHWVDVFLTPQLCMHCSNEFLKIDKFKFQSGGRANFCSELCDVQYSARLDPNATDNWDNGTVYRIVHKPTGKFYVGVTTRWLMMRWWEHIKAESGSPFHQFIKENDITDFTFEVLESFRPSQQNAYEREAYWINKLNAIEIGFNTASAHKIKEKNVF